MLRTETVINQQTRLLMAQMGCQIWRNNVGAFQDTTGRWIRYGLANESKQMNDKIKSSDLIGVTPVLITPALIGRTLGVFTALETKPEGWVKIPSDKRAEAQQKYHNIVKDVGGFAGFVKQPEDVYRIIEL